MGSVSLPLVDRSARCFRAKEGEPRNTRIHIFFLITLKHREFPSPNVVSRLSFLCLPNDKGGKGERDWDQGCQSTSCKLNGARNTFRHCRAHFYTFVGQGLLKELYNNAMNVLSIKMHVFKHLRCFFNRTSAFYVHH